MGLFKRDKDDKEKTDETELKNLLTIHYDCLNSNKSSEGSQMVIESISYANKEDAVINNEPYPENIPSILAPSMSNKLYVIWLREKEGNRYLPIWIGETEAGAISIALQGTEMPRPLTHDFLCSIIVRLGASVKFVVINELKDECWYAKTIIDYMHDLIVADCRPSDAIAIAVRIGAPIYTTKEVLEKAGVIPNANDFPISDK